MTFGLPKPVKPSHLKPGNAWSGSATGGGAAGLKSGVGGTGSTRAAMGFAGWLLASLAADEALAPSTTSRASGLVTVATLFIVGPEIDEGAPQAARDTAAIMMATTFHITSYNAGSRHLSRLAP
jgi:hypothetical protein